MSYELWNWSLRRLRQSSITFKGTVSVSEAGVFKIVGASREVPHLGETVAWPFRSGSELDRGSQERALVDTRGARVGANLNLEDRRRTFEVHA